MALIEAALFFPLNPMVVHFNIKPIQAQPPFHLALQPIKNTK